MSLIERALERMKHQQAARKDGPPTPQPVVPDASAAAVAPAAPPADLEPLPHRGDLSVTIDVATLRASGVLAPRDEERRLAEEYRIIKRPLLKAITEGTAAQQRNIVAVTSALPGEGKTFTSVNLALSLALERGRQVVLVDGDVAKRDVTRLFGLDRQPGLLDLGGDAGQALEGALIRADLASLYILPAGTPNSEGTEILRSERTAALLARLAADPRRIVLVDSPPLLVTSEAGVLAQLAGQVVLVVRASETPQEVVLRAAEAVAEDKPISLVLNQVLSPPERHYGYYYGGYGDGYRYGENDLGSRPPGESS